MQPYRQNYLYARGKLARTDRGFELTPAADAAMRLAGAEPKLP